MLLHRTGGTVNLAPLRTAYTGLRKASALTHRPEALSESDLADWVAQTARAL